HRVASVDPLRLPAAASEHLTACSSCNAHVARLRDTDSQISELMRRPRREGLHQRLLTTSRRQPTHHHRWAMAASMLLAVGLAAFLWNGQREVSPARWAAAMSEHLLEDPLHQAAMDPQADAEFRKALEKLGATGDAGLPRAVRTSMCVMHGQDAVHVVFDVEGQQVVAFLMPSEVGSARLSTQGWDGELSPMTGGAAMAIFARDPELVARTARSLESSVHWQNL
ncbi:MAG: DUF3379 domain-containing protein, partial [Pseudomonadota bacterium]|nr:DUF3379 domain-containing protein [Pseudomonadota bacterium]